jgi:glycosyltransferase involved in cell wall biosynthesis
MLDLSIIIPVYNSSKYLEHSFAMLKPLYNCDFTFEILYVNDGSTDSSAKILERFEKENDFIKVLYQENHGLSEARNYGIKNARGNYFILVDSDDWVEIAGIAKIYSIAHNNRLEVVGFKYQHIDENFNMGILSQTHSLPYEKIITGQEALIYGYQPSSACLFMYESSFIQSNIAFYKGIMQEDVEFTVRLFIKAKRVFFTKIVAYKYYRRSDSMTTTLSKIRKQNYLADSITVAYKIRENILINNFNDVKLIKAIQKNYNSVVWNLIWRFISKPKEVDNVFKLKCLQDLKQKQLYPINGPLKTNFQRITRLFLNQEWLLKFVWR